MGFVAVVLVGHALKWQLAQRPLDASAGAAARASASVRLGVVPAALLLFFALAPLLGTFLSCSLEPVEGAMLLDGLGQVALGYESPWTEPTHSFGR